MHHYTRMFLAVVVLVSFISFGQSINADIESSLESRQKRIVGGKPATNTDYPFAVALFNNGDYICTGIIISKNWIMTAAHCVIEDTVLQDAEDYYAVAGNANRSSPAATYINFKHISVHPGYNQMANDIAILETTEPIKFGKNINQICLANEKIGSLWLSSVVAVGWGQTNRDTDKPVLPEILQHVDQRVVGNLKCWILFFGNPVPSTAICATSLSSGICGGDSGGPLVYYPNSRPVLVGMASYVNGIAGCGHLLGPAAFTRISSYTQFIKETAKGDVCVA